MNAWSIALDSIWHHKLRSTLTALGVVIGVFAVVTLTSLGAGVRNYVTSQFNSFGADLITVAPAAPPAPKASGSGGGPFGGPNAFVQTPSTLTVADAQAIAGLGGGQVRAALPVATAAAHVLAGAAVAPVSVVQGVTAPYFAAERLHFAAGGVGAGFSSGAVLGHAVALALSPGDAAGAVGRALTINGSRSTVVGVLAPAGNQFGVSADGSVFVPVDIALTLSGTSTVSQIIVRATSTGAVHGAVAAITQLMDQRHPLKDFAVVTAGQILKTIQQTLSVITSVLGGIAAISLLVGGIGIMNIMLVTVTERVREIGTRKAMGARDGDILVQFLVESVLLALLGGAIGTALSALVGGVVGKVAKIPLGLTDSSVALALGFSVLVGAVFGVLPALNAARLMPADALRSE